MADNIEQAARRIEAEVKRLVATINDEVVPAVRADGSKALRRLAEAMSKMADSIERPGPGAR